MVSMPRITWRQLTPALQKPPQDTTYTIGAPQLTAPAPTPHHKAPALFLLTTFALFLCTLNLIFYKT